MDDDGVRCRLSFSSGRNGENGRKNYEGSATLHQDRITLKGALLSGI